MYLSLNRFNIMPEPQPSKANQLIKKIYIGISIVIALNGIILSLTSIILGTRAFSKAMRVDVSLIVLGVFFLILGACTFAVMWLIFGTTKPFLLFIMIYTICILLSSIFSIIALSIKIPKAIKSVKDGCTHPHAFMQQYLDAVPNYNIFGVHELCPVQLNYNLTEMANIFTNYSIILNNQFDGYINVPSNIQDKCHAQIYKDGGHYDRKIAHYFNIIENQWNCSGLCSKSPIYYFSNTLKGVPESSCDRVVINDIKSIYVVLYELIVLGLLSIAQGAINVIILLKVKSDTASNTVPIEMVNSNSNNQNSDVLENSNIAINMV